MGIPVLILGKSGSGKSASMRNFPPDEVGVLNVASKPLPFRNGSKFKVINGCDYATIAKTLRRHALDTYVIDDSQYLMAFESFHMAGVKGYEKFTNMAVNFYNMIQLIIRELPNDVIVYLLHHVEEADDGTVKAKTIGKMIDQQLTLEGLFSIVLMAVTVEGKHCFLTRTDGRNSVKTPMDMFNEELIDNDLKAVDTAIREYYGIPKKEDNENE